MIDITPPPVITIDLAGPSVTTLDLQVASNTIEVTEPAPVVIDITASPTVTLDVNTGIVGNGIASITQPTPDTLLVTYTNGDTATFTLPSGVGIADLEIVDVDLVVTYTDATTQNLGRVVGYNGTNGTNGTNGRAITGTAITGNDLILTFDQGTSPVNVGRVVGYNGQNGDRYATTSTTSISIPNPNQQRTLTIGTGLAYTNQQTIIVATVDGSGHHWHGTVDSYNSTTGSITATCTAKTGDGTYANWEVNLSGAVGTDGTNGYSPILAVVTDNTRRVLQITDWTGGTGTKPATGYIGATGIVTNIANAVDIRGAAGSNGTNGTNGATIIYGTTNPTSGIGADGDTYINSTTYFVFGPKSGGVWPSGVALKGPKGDTGNTGATGNGIASITQPNGPSTALVTYTDATTNTFNIPGGLTGINFYQFLDHFTTPSASATNTTFGTGWFVTTNSTGGGGLFSTDASGITSSRGLGIAIQRTGTTALGYGLAQRAGRGGTASNYINVANGAISQIWIVQLQTLPTSTDDYTVNLGWSGNSGVPLFSGGTANWVGFTIVRTTGTTVRFRARSISAGTETNVTGSVDLVAATWYVLRIEYTASSILYYVNGTLIATINTNIPTNAWMYATLYSVKTAGTNSRDVNVDVYYEAQTLTSQWTI